jgi:transcription initiation factor TFIIIB Brf1 subunit/transcription initiation factor TFIIB
MGVLPLPWEHKRKSAGASRIQVFVASNLAAVCRRAVHTRSFEYLLLHMIRTAVLKRRSRLLNTQLRHNAPWDSWAKATRKSKFCQ